ncbi:ATP:guanido phosphotransferase, C-terminal catalytic domain protein [Candidatus Moduliflexus flocculans]|uniref:ATP:guanido phosphotransferase, C-terminal catalytic domain protein n=1 Tax=Candidatus Moduliflexus flocculans TaxID=1499966 RepID=A0A0S6VUS1_9BACT|nr:ATP:guanido phosphotransferase, C-terminal catalytic domain protein [Candidatus Moduliflexus flocculans]
MGKFGMEPWHNQSAVSSLPRTTLPYVVSSRVRLARNLVSYRFPRMASNDERRAVLARMQEVAISHPSFRHAHVMLLDECSPLERKRLAEKHLISHLLATPGTFQAVILFERLSASILVNEEDHLRIQAFSSGLRVQRLWNIAKFLAQSCEEMLDFAKAEPYRYLTTTPENSGIGLRASIMLFVPALILLKRINRLLLLCAKAGYVVRGIDGEGSSSAGFMLQISCQRPQERHEQRILREITLLGRTVMAQEQRARHVLLTRRQHLFQERLAWVGHQLQTAHAIDCQLGMTLIGWCRLSVAAGIPLPHYAEMMNQHTQHRWLKILDALQIHIQPAHIRQYCKDEAQEFAAREDAIRAVLMRSVICPA